MDEDANWYGTGHVVLDGFPALRGRGTARPPFRRMSIVATVAHLSYCWAPVFPALAVHKRRSPQMIALCLLTYTQVQLGSSEPVWS